MSGFKNLTGQVFGRLTVTERANNILNHAAWKCQCSCGNTKVIRGGSLRNGDTTSCGCRSAEVTSEMTKRRWEDGEFDTCQFKTHGMSGTDTYSIYRGMLNRCRNPDVVVYKYYGAKGVDVCERWQESFENFYEDMGDRPSKDHSLERTDGTKGYEPGNVAWATRTEQGRNRGMMTNNTSGKTGVSYQANINSWYAVAINPRTNRPVRRYFACVKHGDAAYDKACEARDELIRQFNEEGAGYSEKHGL